MNIYRAYLESPVGLIEITASEEAILSLLFENKIQSPVSSTPAELQPPHLKEALNQVKAWFEGQLQYFDLPVHLQGTSFQQQVWKELERIPYGETLTYARLAARLGKAEAIRATGSAVGKNKINIIIPCHRVIGSKGQLTGYGGEIWRKAWLLRFEQEVRGSRLRF